MNSAGLARRRDRILAIVLMVALAGCASSGTAQLPSESHTLPPAPVNLSGFPPAYRQGHADGCASVGGRDRRDAVRYGNDADYRLGWNDGRALCAKR